MIVYQATPDYYNEYIKHYGVMGMKWGIRKDLRRSGSISDKTKKKMKKALSTASYRKTRRMLNGLEDLKSDYKSRTEGYKSKNKSDKAKIEKSNASHIEKISKNVQKSAAKKGYKYDVQKNFTRYSNRAKGGMMLGAMLAGATGATGTQVYQGQAHKNYIKKNGGQTSKYIDQSGVYYRNQKKKKK